VCARGNAYAGLGVQNVHEQGQSAARGWSTGSAGGGQGLGNGDGVQEVSWARQQQEACLLRLGPLGRALGHLRVSKEGEVDQARAGIGRQRGWRGAKVGGGSMPIGGIGWVW
jgi:hypothetical protein